MSERILLATICPKYHPTSRLVFSILVVSSTPCLMLVTIPLAKRRVAASALPVAFSTQSKVCIFFSSFSMTFWCVFITSLFMKFSASVSLFIFPIALLILSIAATCLADRVSNLLASFSTLLIALATLTSTQRFRFAPAIIKIVRVLALTIYSYVLFSTVIQCSASGSLLTS